MLQMTARIPIKPSLAQKEEILNGKYIFEEGQNLISKHLERHYKEKQAGRKPGETGGSL